MSHSFHAFSHVLLRSDGGGRHRTIREDPCGRVQSPVYRFILSHACLVATGGNSLILTSSFTCPSGPEATRAVHSWNTTMVAGPKSFIKHFAWQSAEGKEMLMSNSAVPESAYSFLIWRPTDIFGGGEANVRYHVPFRPQDATPHWAILNRHFHCMFPFPFPDLQIGTLVGWKYTMYEPHTAQQSVRWAPCQMTSLSCACSFHTSNCRRRLRHDSNMTSPASRLGRSSPSCADA